MTLVVVVLCIGLTYNPSAGPVLDELIDPAVEGSDPLLSWEARRSLSGAWRKKGERALVALMQFGRAH